MSTGPAVLSHRDPTERSWHGRYCKLAWVVAPLWSALLLFLPQVRRDLYTGLNVVGVEPSWWRAAAWAAVAGLLFVVLAWALRKLIVLSTPLSVPLAAVALFVSGYWLFSFAFALSLEVERNRLPAEASLNTVLAAAGAYIVGMPVFGFVFTVERDPLRWLAGLALAFLSVLLLRQAASSERKLGAAAP